jgi:hypothetical protein
MDDAALVLEFRSLVTDGAVGVGPLKHYPRDDAYRHVASILPVVAKYLRMTETQLAQFARERSEGRQVKINGMMV